MRVFVEIDHPGCVVAATGPLGKPTECHSAPTHAGLVLFEVPAPSSVAGVRMPLSNPQS